MGALDVQDMGIKLCKLCTEEGAATPCPGTPWGHSAQGRRTQTRWGGRAFVQLGGSGPVFQSL